MLKLIVLLCFILKLVNSFHIKSSSISRKNVLKAVASSVDTTSGAYVVKGNEGLLDSSRMDRAFKGSGIKIPSNKKLSVGIIGSGLAGMITAKELAEAGHDVHF